MVSAISWRIMPRTMLLRGEFWRNAALCRNIPGSTRMHCAGGEAAGAVAELFGEDFLLPDGATDRAKLARLAFSDETARRRLEERLHPIVRNWLLRWKDGAGGSSPVRIAQIPLLFDRDWAGDWDRTATVETSSMAVRFARLASRGLSRAEAGRRIASQLPADRRIRLADFVIRNDGSVEQLETTAKTLFRFLENECK